MDDILHFFKDPKTLGGISFGKEKEEIIKMLGEPEDSEHFADQEILHYPNGIVYRFQEGKMIELGIDFISNDKLKYAIHVEEISDVKFITSKTQVHTIIRFLKWLKIPWHSYDEAHLMSTSIKTVQNLCFIFDPDDGEIARILYRGY